MNSDNTHMYDALNYAKQHAIGDQGHVGAVLVHEGVIHARAASNDNEGVHAEQAVLEGVNAISSTMYVTIQPSLYRSDSTVMSDSEFIVQSGVSRVVVGSINKKYSLEESVQFFSKHDVEFALIEDEKLSGACLDLFVSTGADQESKK